MAYARKFAAAVKAAVPAVAGMGLLSSMSTPRAEEVLHPPHYKWDFNKPFTSFDAASIRRGYQVYTQVCASCHSLKFIHFRDLVGVCFSEAEAKALAEEIEVEDGPDDNGEMFDRPGKLSDAFPAPYANEEQARAINNGALPPDLSLIVKARHSGDDYLFALLTGYRDAPAGVTVNEDAGQYYNPYFPGSKIGMPKQLVDGAVEYDDGTPATASQMAKDVVSFLAWASEPHQDNRKRLGWQFLVAMIAAAAGTGYWKRFRWGPLKAMKVTFKQ